jgi:hypothetical protein
MMIVETPFWHTFFFYGKITGAASAFFSAATYLYKKLVSPVVNKVVHINDTVSALATNHFPHIQAALDSQDVEIAEIKMGVAQYGGRLDSTDHTVKMLHQSLVNHLESVSSETPRKKRNAVRVNRATRISPRAPRNSR